MAAAYARCAAPDKLKLLKTTLFAAMSAIFFSIHVRAA
jgi:hypothetical protein